MNYAGIFNAAISLDGGGSHSPSDVHVDSFTGKPFIAKAQGHVPDGAFVVPDPNLIFNGEYKRAGSDLVLSHDGHEFIVHDYFRGDKRAALSSPDGAHLSGDIVNALTGHVQYAQAASGIAAAQVIGHVTKLSGSATAVRNGVSIILNNGDNVEKGDVVSTGGDSTLGITFIDGTVFGLSSNARMVLNEMVYDPNGSNNSSLLSLVAGTITFVAGETAKHGDMKIDTPVATMGIRGTAVLSQIHFVVPAGGGEPQPEASFQVLVEPNGTTGSYILFDKVTLLPIATVNQAGQMIQISGGNVSISNALMSPDVQKLITDVFTLKFTDNNTNTKLTTNFTDSITQTSYDILLKTPTGATAIATFANLNPQGPQGPGTSTSTSNRIPGPPDARTLDLNGNVTSEFALTERANTTGDTTHSDTISGLITFLDQNLGDRPTVSVSLGDAPNYVYKDAGLHDVTGSLTSLQKQDIAATLINIDVVAKGGNTNTGSAVWTYTIPDHVFDFLAAGETLTLTYTVRIANNFTVSPDTATRTITITITGTNDKPVITSSVPTITFEGGTSVAGGPLTSEVPTSGTLTFKDVDLTDTHTVAVKLTSATLPDGTVPPGPLALFQSAMSAAIAAGADSKGSGTGTINWSLADLPVYLADFIPKGEVLTLVYTVTLTDAQGATSQQTITVTITGTDAAAVVWIATDKAGAPSGGFWKDAANWETGTVPTIDDDVIVITDQLHGLTPSYPVTIDTAAYAKSITMNDFGGPPPEVINKSLLTISGALNMSADSIFTNSAAGVMSVGGKAEILGTSVLTNAGYLTLAGGGDFAKGTTITNLGMIELSGGTLKTLALIHNAGGMLKADAGTTLIVDTATIDGGTVAILGTLELDGISLIENGTLNNSGAVNVKGAAKFAHETLSNTSSGTIKVLANGWLTIDQGSGVTNTGNVTVDATGKLTVNGTTISGAGTVTDDGEIDLTGNAVLSGGVLMNNAVFKVSGTGNALDGETVTNAGTIEVLANGVLAIDHGSTVNNSSGSVIVDATAALTLDHATISGGAINGGGTIHVTGASKIDGGATLSVSAVTADAKLTLDGVTVSGSTITDNSSIELDNTVKLKDAAKIQGGAITNNGTLEIAGAATLLNDVLTNTGHIVKVNDGQTLTLSGTEITGGTIDNYSVLGGTIGVTGDSKIDGNATLNKGAVAIETGVALTLDDAIVAGTAITNGGTIKVDTSKKLTLAGASLTGGTLTVAGTLASSGITSITDANISNGYLLESTLGGLLTLVATTPAAAITNSGIIRANGAKLDIDHETVANTGTLAAINTGTLKLISATVTNTGSGAVSVESGSTLDLVGAIIDGGTVTIAGTLESTGASAINDADITNTGSITVSGGTLTIDPGTVHAITNHGLIEATGGGTLKLTTATIANTGASITVDCTSKLYLTDVTINGGSLSNAGNLYSAGLDTVTGCVTNTGIIEVQSGTLDLAGGIAGSGKVIVDVGATLEFSGATGSIHIVNSGSIVGTGGNAAIHIQQDTTGSVIDNSGTIGPAAALSATDAIVETGGSLTINNTGHINGNISVASATFNNDSGGTWTVAGTSVFGNASSIVNDGVIDLLNGASISLSGPGLVNHNHIDSWGTASISGTIANTGSIEVHDGELSLFGSLSGTGSVTVDAGALLKLEGTVAQTINLAGDGAALEIDTSTFGGSIAELSANDTIDLSTIVYDDGTSATYNAATGELVVSDAYHHTITLQLTGADYSGAHFAGSSDGHGGTLITFNADDYKPAFTAAGATLTATVPELENTTSSSTLDPTPTAATGSIDFKDVDLTDRPTACITGQTVSWTGADHITNLSGFLTTDQINALEHALSLQSTGKNNGEVGWSYSIADGTLDFLGQDQTVKVMSTVMLDDGHNKTDTAQVTVTITGANDAPALNIDQASVTQVGDQVTVHGLSVADPDTNDAFTIAATAASCASVTPSSGCGSLAIINSALQTLTYTEASSGGPATDEIAVNVTDAHGASDTVNLIFNLTETAVSLTGTSDKDVFFGTVYQDQFVFATKSNHDTIVNFTSGTDHIDLSFVGTSNVSDWMAHHVAASGADTLITIDAADTILVKGVSLQTNDFILHVT
ncbi:VCBS domain-containing protein [Bradyrhizobium sp. 38]|nr:MULTISPECIES: VCBS domain-containing protein [unclassified Bradyrhizobium]MCK1338241.1 VCBS domain-containing protein [Bradyrhizobium sp. 38]MCK1777737.1 VCBS domain-containing protein [Bradyrhizobium sp. 132]